MMAEVYRTDALMIAQDICKSSNSALQWWPTRQEEAIWINKTTTESTWSVQEDTELRECLI